MLPSALTIRVVAENALQVDGSNSNATDERIRVGIRVAEPT